MSEKLHEKIESAPEQINLEETSKHKLERLKEEAASVEHDHSLDKIHESIHKEAISGSEITIGEHQEDASQQMFGVQRELKNDAYRRTMSRVRSHLNPSERLLSKVVHGRVIEPISEASSKTIARPSAILGGGIAALVGSGTVLYMAKHYGFRYNFTTFLLLLATGYITGLLVEGILRLSRRNKTQ